MKTFAFVSAIIALFAFAEAQNPVCPPGEVAYFPFPFDCGKYLHCDNGNPVLESCPGGLEWSQEFLTCTWPSQANCEATPMPTLPPSTTTESWDDETTESDDGGNSTEDPDYYYEEDYNEDGDARAGETTQEPEVTTAAPWEPECPSTGVNYLANPYDCSSYYVCVFGEPIQMECAEGTEWSQDLLTCIHEEDSDCTPL